jgi:hypothetical protein
VFIKPNHGWIADSIMAAVMAGQQITAETVTPAPWNK